MTQENSQTTFDFPQAKPEQIKLMISKKIAKELNVRDQQVVATIELIDDGATIPFIARYRKEVTGALDDSQLRTLEERLRYLTELEAGRLHEGVKHFEHHSNLPFAAAQVLEEPSH